MKTHKFVWGLAAAAMVLSLIGLGARGQQAEPEPVEVEVTMRDGKEFTADLVKVEEAQVTFKLRGKEVIHPIEDIHPWSVFEIRSLAMGFDNPRIFVEYGRQELNWYEDEEEAEMWFKRALDRDKSLHKLVKVIRSNPEKPVDVNPDAEVEGQKFRQSHPDAEAAILELVDGWHEVIKEKVKSECAKIETDHFLIYTTWDKRDHRALAKVCEKLYSRLCKEFDINRKHNIWSPKLPIYVFWTEREFNRFNVNCLLRPSGIRAGGYCWSRMGVTFVVLNQVKYSQLTKAEAQQWFFELLVHETTHAFNARYLSDIKLPTWYNEGIAELMAAELVPGCRADKWWRSATRYVRDGSVDIETNFDRFRGSRLDYAVMQSLVRYMMFKKKKEFITFYKLLKDGMDQDDALKEAYGVTRQELVDKWLHAARAM